MRSDFTFARITTMRCGIVAACIFATACGETSPSPLSPTSTTQVGQPQAQGGEQLPFQGSLQGLETDLVVPPNLMVNGTATGTGAHIGRFTAAFTATVALATGSSTGNITFIGANGDRLDATFIGQGNPTAEPDVASIEEVATITGGTGRFADVTGGFTIRRIVNLVTGVSSGSFDGTINGGH